MNPKNICINSRDRSLYQHGVRAENGIPENGASESNTKKGSTKESNTAASLSNFACSFARIDKNGQPALLANISVHICSKAEDTLPTLLYHAEELNIRLPFLRVSVRNDFERINPEQSVSAPDSSAPDSSALGYRQPEYPYRFILHGLFCGEINSGNMTDFLNRLTQDFQPFLAYAKAHNIQILHTD
ncbi:MAG: hypothetical protein AAFZ17_19075 [Cyanobacteria bacterium J06650_10]